MPESSQNADLRAKLLKYASFLLARKPYFSSQIRKKLLDKQASISEVNNQETVDEIIADLVKAKYLNDKYLLLGFIRQKLKKLQGPKIITYKLKMLGLSSRQIQQALDQDEIKELVAESIQSLTKKYSIEDQFKAKAKLYQRGF